MSFNIKVPYFKQESWYTCGPACLRMALAYLGIIKTEKEVTEACGTTELGTTSTQIPATFQKYGIKASSVKNANIEDLKQEINEGRPVIVLIDPSYIYGGVGGFGHFIVIVGFKEDEVTYHDPDEPNGEYMKCELKAFLMAWNATKCWMIKLDKE
ncbi:Peptidase_C39 like family protein [uncultured archaeon]|nr:Peptidase_C39 like family protein [uncultured archaeon]